MKSFAVDFCSDENKIIIMAMFLCTIFFGFIPALIVVLCLKNRISESSYTVSKALLNFEILIIILSIMLMLVSFIPILGWIIGIIGCPILYIVNVVIALMAVFAISSNQEVKIPVLFEFI